MEISQVFDASTIGVAELFREPGRCFYVPIYQRQYSWDNRHIDRLVSDISHGVEQMTSSVESITFLGTIIMIHDTKFTTVEPQVKGQLPPKVMTVIDGQQRLTTLLLMVAALHDEISSRWRKLLESGDKSLPTEWLSRMCMETLPTLAKMLEDDRDFGDRKFYPRMIRAIVDRWSRDAALARYESPIGEFLANYGDHVRSGSNSVYTHEGDEGIRNRFRKMRKILKGTVASTSAAEDDETQFPSIERILIKSSFVTELFQDDVPEVVRSILLTESGEADFEREIFRILTFARFLLDRTAVTLVVAKSEEFAFDMFEALNTTGEPLTAVETFKPRVIRSEGYSQYEQSESAVYMSEVEKYLGRFDTADSRQTNTAELLVPFALAEAGVKLSKRLNEQRRFLMNRYEDLEDGLEERRNFVRQLAMTSQVLDEAWEPKSKVPALAQLTFDTETRLCMSMLRSANHQIVVGPLARFYSLYRTGELGEEDVRGAIRSFAAFFALWRGAFGGTHNIDTLYRELMSAGSADEEVRPFARRPSLDVPFNPEWKVSNTALQAFFRTRLIAAGIGSRKSWVERASVTPVYVSSKPLTRFLLLAATHDSVPDSVELGLSKPGSRGVLPLLNHETWAGEGTLSVEHIAPQTQTADWEPSLYVDANMIHRLGNLVLVPVAENSGLSNLSWMSKRACYRVLSATSPDAAEEAKATAKAQGVNLPESIANNKSYRPVAAGVAGYDSNWNSDIVAARSERLADLAWSQLAPWIGLPN